MHELSIAMSMIDVASEEAERRGKRVIAIHLRLGPLSGVVTDALVSAYELACEGSPVEDARLEIEEIPIRMHCLTCQSHRPVVSIQDLRCTQCGAPAEEITSGRELEVFALEFALENEE